MDIIKDTFSFIWLITTIFSVLYFLYKVISWFFWISPVLFRLWIWLSNRKIAIFSDSDNFKHLEKLIIDSRLFKKSKIESISNTDIDSAKQKNIIFLLDWGSFSENIDKVLNIKEDQTPLIIFAKPWIIPNDKMSEIGNKRNTVVVNFRWRLLNDVLTSLITTWYQK